MTDNGLKTPSPSEEIEMLIPWYVMGRIDDADRERVERYLEDHPEARDQLELVREEIAGTDALSEALGAPRAGSLSKLLADIEAADGPAIARGQAPSLAERLSAWLPDFNSPALQMAGIAAAVLIVAQAVVIGTLVGGRDGGAQYETASEGGAPTLQAGTRLLVSFSPDATAKAITTLLSDMDATIVSGPKGSGLFEIRVSDKKLSEAEVERVIAELKRNDAVGFAAKAQ